MALFKRAPTTADPEGRMSFMEHLGELRTRIVRALVALLVGLVITLPFSEKIVDFLARPIKKMGHTLIFTAPTEAFWVQMKVALIAGLFLAVPGHPLAGVALRGAGATSAREEVRRSRSSSSAPCSSSGAGPSRCSW